MTTNVFIPGKLLARAASDTSPIPQGFVSMEPYSPQSNDCRMLGIWSGAASYLWTTKILEPNVIKTLMFRGLVPKDIQRSEMLTESVPSSKRMSMYHVKGLVTGGTLTFGTVLARSAPLTDFTNLNFRSSMFEDAGLVNMTFQINLAEPLTCHVNTIVDPQNVQYCLAAQGSDIFGGRPSARPKGRSSTDGEPPKTAVDDELVRLLSSAKGMRFEDGTESSFSKALVRLFEKGGRASFLTLSKLVPAMDANVFAEVLRWVARVDDPASADERRWLLEAGLSSRSPLVRDVATSGLALLQDRRSLPSLRKAIDLERIAPLRSDMEELARDLEGDHGAKAS